MTDGVLEVVRCTALAAGVDLAKDNNQTDVSVPFPCDDIADARGFARRERDSNGADPWWSSVPSSSIVEKPELLTAMRTASPVTLMQ